MKQPEGGDRETEGKHIFGPPTIMPGKLCFVGPMWLLVLVKTNKHNKIQSIKDYRYQYAVYLDCPDKR